jgi:hypothetical protein
MSHCLLSLVLSVLLLIGCRPEGTVPLASSARSAPRPAAPPPERVVAPVARSIAGVEYELGKGRSELTIDAEGWIARRGWIDLEGRSLDDVPIARVVGDVAYDLRGAALARIDATGRVVSPFPTDVQSAVPIRIDDDGFLVGWHGHRLDEDFVLEGDRARRRDLALAYAATYLLPIFSVPEPARSAD